MTPIPQRQDVDAEATLPILRDWRARLIGDEFNADSLQIGSLRAHALIGVSHGNCAATRIRAL
jgi:hypothetical protein